MTGTRRRSARQVGRTLTQAARPGDVLADRYKLVDLLSESGSGRFWRAHDDVLDRHVALHCIAEDDERAPGLTEAARLSATVLDRRLLRVLDADHGDGMSYVVNEWGTGTSLDILIGTEGPLPPRKAAWVVSEVAASIAVAHEERVAHGRLVPETVLLDNTGSVRIIGCCVDAALRGLPSGRIGQDVTDLGGLLYFALTGRWAGVSASNVRSAPRSGSRWLRPRQVRAGIPRVLDGICDVVLNPYAPPTGQPHNVLTAAGLAEALREYVGDPVGMAEATPLNGVRGAGALAVPARAPSATRTPPAPSRRPSRTPRRRPTPRSRPSRTTSRPRRRRPVAGDLRDDDAPAGSDDAPTLTAPTVPPTVVTPRSPPRRFGRHPSVDRRPRRPRRPRRTRHGRRARGRRRDARPGRPAHRGRHADLRRRRRRRQLVLGAQRPAAPSAAARGPARAAPVRARAHRRRPGPAAPARRDDHLAARVLALGHRGRLRHRQRCDPGDRGRPGRRRRRPGSLLVPPRGARGRLAAAGARGARRLQPRPRQDPARRRARGGVAVGLAQRDPAAVAGDRAGRRARLRPPGRPAGGEPRPRPAGRRRRRHDRLGHPDLLRPVRAATRPEDRDRARRRPRGLPGGLAGRPDDPRLADGRVVLPHRRRPDGRRGSGARGERQRCRRHAAHHLRGAGDRALPHRLDHSLPPVGGDFRAEIAEVEVKG